MKTIALISGAAMALVLALATPAAAHGKGKVPAKVAKLLGTYKVKFEAVVDTCRGTGTDLDRGKVKISHKKGKRITINVPLIPNMRGVVLIKKKGIRFSAKARRGPSMIRGLSIRPRVDGHLTGGIIEMMVVADYFIRKKPHCTQSWKVSGVPYKGKKKKNKRK
jgi:hypothetical protein